MARMPLGGFVRYGTVAAAQLALAAVVPGTLRVDPGTRGAFAIQDEKATKEQDVKRKIKENKITKTTKEQDVKMKIIGAPSAAAASCVAKGIVEACAKYRSNAALSMIVNPVTSMVPAMAELDKKKGLNKSSMPRTGTPGCRSLVARQSSCSAAALPIG